MADKGKIISLFVVSLLSRSLACLAGTNPMCGMRTESLRVRETRQTHEKGNEPAMAKQTTNSEPLSQKLKADAGAKTRNSELGTRNPEPGTSAFSHPLTTS